MLFGVKDVAGFAKNYQKRLVARDSIASGWKECSQRRFVYSVKSCGTEGRSGQIRPRLSEQATLNIPFSSASQPIFAIAMHSLSHRIGLVCILHLKPCVDDSMLGGFTTLPTFHAAPRRFGLFSTTQNFAMKCLGQETSQGRKVFAQPLVLGQCS